MYEDFSARFRPCPQRNTRTDGNVHTMNQKPFIIAKMDTVPRLVALLMNSFIFKPGVQLKKKLLMISFLTPSPSHNKISRYGISPSAISAVSVLNKLASSKNTAGIRGHKELPLNSYDKMTNFFSWKYLNATPQLPECANLLGTSYLVNRHAIFMSRDCSLDKYF